ncbi:MAG: hypothetical protein M3525_07140, partial [Acidobacteriota bacterium]|nr:hypothetical protein [Acidobacteriota bacterium]
MKKGFGIIAIVIICIGAVVGGFFSRLPVRTSADTTVTADRIVADYREALDVIGKNYVGQINHEKV